MQDNKAWDAAFSGNEDRILPFTRTVLAYLGKPENGRNVRVLDLGCGCGAQAFLLAEALPTSRVVGIDISRSSIQQAEETLRRRPYRDRVTFLCGDYLQTDLSGFDVITADSVLHLILGDRQALFAKLTGDLNRDGLLFFSIPYPCLFNTLLTGLRHCLRLCRSPATDWAIARLSRLLHGRAKSDEFLQERLAYAYLIPRVWGNRRLRDHLQGELGLSLVAVGDNPHTSLGQLKHKIWIYQKKMGDTDEQSGQSQTDPLAA